MVGSVSAFFTADFLVATDRLELLCRQSDAIRMKRSVCHAISVLFISVVVMLLHVWYVIGFRFESHLIN